MRRFIDGYFVGNYSCWGIDNKEVPIRIVCPSAKTTNGLGGIVTNLELKSFDHTSNMYLAFAAIISCGIDGIRRSLNLPRPV